MEVMHRHDLDYNRTIHYFCDHIDGGTVLSKKILDNTDFKTGSFFTILPYNANLKNLYNFREGNIVPQPTTAKPYRIGTHGSQYWGYPLVSLDVELSRWMLEYLEQALGNQVIMDHAIARSTDRHVQIEEVQVAFCENEVYYLWQEPCTSADILKVIRKTKNFWHFLAVLTNGLTVNSLTLHLTDFDTVCQNSRYVVAGAYDGEGYIIWERREDPKGNSGS